MARPRKEGMDYFPHDVHASADEKLESLIMQYGARGYAFFFMHLEYIYRRDELEVNVTPMFRRLICVKLQITEAEYDELLRASFEVGCFDEAHYRDTGCLTSHGVQKRAEVVFAERAKDRVRKKKFPQENQDSAPESGSIPELSGGFPPENSRITTGIREFSGIIRPKGKERKGKDIPDGISDSAERLPAGNPSTPPDALPPEPESEPESPPVGIGIPLVDGTEYAVTAHDVAQWQDAYPAVDVIQELRQMRSWADANPKKRKTRRGIRRFANSWLAREQDRGGNNSRAAYSGGTNAHAAANPGRQIGELTFT